MNIDHAFIMSAGYGTRMGEIGKLLPKVLWRVFDKTLLELQILYAASMGVKNIFINSFHGHDLVKAHFVELKKKYANIYLIKEPCLLGSGGGVHSFCRHEKVNYKGTAVYLSGDQFLFPDKQEFETGKNHLHEFGNCLFPIEVDAKAGYNETVIKDSKLEKIQKPSSQQKKHLTFSGMAFLDLAKLTPRVGISSFFDSVCNYKEKIVMFNEITDQQYWDFGTLDRYYGSIYKLFDLLVEGESRFLTVFPKNKFLNEEKICAKFQSYNCKNKSGVLNFSKTLISEKFDIKNSIIMAGEVKQHLDRAVCYDNITEKVIL